MITNNKKINMSDFLFFTSYVLYLIITLLNITFWAAYFSDGLVKLCMIICSVILIIKEIVCDKVGIKEIVLLLLCIALSSIMLLHLNKIVMFPFFIFLYSARKIEFKKIAKCTILVSGFVLFGTIVAAKSGIIMNYVSYSELRRREYLGFLYSLFPQMILFNITALCIYTYKFNGKKKIVFYFVLFILNYFIYKYTNSRLSFGLTCALLLIAYFLKDNSKNRFKKLFVYSYIICTIVSLFLTINYNPSNTKLKSLNVVLEDRLYLGKQSLETYGVSLFGSNVRFVGNGLDLQGQKSKRKYNYVDCMYLNLLERYGIVFFIVIIALLTYLLHNAYEEDDKLLMYILLIIALHGIIDDLGIYLYYNTFWLLIGRCFTNLKKGKIKENV